LADLPHAVLVRSKQLSASAEQPGARSIDERHNRNHVIKP